MRATFPSAPGCRNEGTPDYAWAGGLSNCKDGAGFSTTGRLLAAANGERVMEPDFRRGFPQHVFALNDPATWNVIACSVQKTPTEHDPWIGVQGVRIESTPDRLHLPRTHVNYRVRSSRRRRTRACPFHLQES